MNSAAVISIVESFISQFRFSQKPRGKAKKRLDKKGLLDDFLSGKNEAVKSQGVDRAGFVWLVGAGPGDAELLTIKAYKAIQNADHILFDWLVDKSVLDMIPKGVTTEFVGKRCGQHSMLQQDICKRLVDLALSGKNVVRLKGGDPAIFARTYEETQALEEVGVQYSIIPGITAASGASAYSGIPLTQRDCAQSVLLTTASLQNTKQEPDWQYLVKQSASQTIVFYMGLGKLSVIVERLQSNGLAADYPIALIDNACTARQTVISGQLNDISQIANDADIQGPAIIVCGEVVKHRQQVTKFAASMTF